MSMQRLIGLYDYFRRLLRTSEHWTVADRKLWQSKMLERKLNLASRLQGYSQCSGQKIQQWPLLTKAMLASEPRAFCARRFLPSREASTGGTTGLPISLRRSLVSVVFEQAAIDHIFALAGLDLRSAKIAVLRGDYVKAPSDMTRPFWRKSGARQLVLSSFHLTEQTLPAYCEELKDFKPDVLMAYPSSLGHFTKLLLNHALHLKIPFVFTSSERLSAETADVARALLKCCVIDYYGQAERVVMAYALDGPNYFFQPLYGHVEFVAADDERRIIVGTSFWNAHQPLVRYHTGDVVALTGIAVEEYEQVSLGLKSFGGIEGRENECIDLLDGRRIIGLNHIPRGLSDVASLQLRKVDGNSIEVLVVPRTPDLSQVSIEQIKYNFYRKFPENVRIEIRVIPMAIRLPNGKAPLLMP